MKFAYIAAALLATLCLTMIGASALAQSTPPTQEATLMARGTFDVKMIPEDDKLGDGITRMVSDKHYHGDLEGDSKGQMLTTGLNANKSGAYVAMETFTGTLQVGSEKRTGSFALHHTGIMRSGAPDLTISVIPESGTGQLAGISGKMNIIIAPDGKHSYDFEYTLPSTH